jgi:RING finger/CHY zinc finger protein 1
LPEDIAMAEVDIKSFDPQEFRLFQQMGSCSQHFNEDFIFSEESMNVETPQILDKGLMEYGYGSVPVCLAKFNSFLPLYLLNMTCSVIRCLHYRRRCRIRAPCCNEVFDCRHCHNEAKVSFFYLKLLYVFDHVARADNLLNMFW